MADVPKWRIAGDWFDVCKCTIPCPCTFAQAPSEGDCEGVLAWHIREGRYGDVPLDGLNVVGVGSFQGNLWAGETKATMGIFLDERADESQRGALQIPSSTGPAARASTSPSTGPGRTSRPVSPCRCPGAP